MVTAVQVRDLLVAVSYLREEQKGLWASDARRFNIFDALDIEYRELSHSKFLAFLLDPYQSHDQGCRYLRSFLQLLDIVPPTTFENIQVVTERPIQHFGQLDILIQIPSELTLCIENKVGAYDQKNQMGRYLSWLKNEVNTKGTRIAVYLSPDGRSPQDPPAAVDLPPLKLLSYKAVADWLQRQPSPERLSTVIRMYIETCKKISGVRLKTPYNDEIEKLLSSPEKFAIALDIADFIALEKPRITERFWKNVCDFLNERLSDALLSNRWKTHLSMEKTGWLAIVKTEIGIDSACGSLGHALTVEGIKTTAACFGIRRGSRKRIDVVDPVDDELVHQLTGLPFKENDWWCGYRGISAGGLLPGTSDANGHVSLFQKDYQETGNPLSVQVADALWNLFSQCRERLEHINKAQHDT